MKKLSLLIIICLLSFQCGYHLRGTGSSLPSHIKTINIPMFKNMTTRYELDLKLTLSVIDELVSRGKVEITADDSSADASLIGEIISFSVNPIAFSGEATADRYNIVVGAKVVLRDRTNNRIIFSNPSYVYQEEYEVPEGTDFETVETQAIERVAEKFARSLVVAVLEGF